MRFIQAFYGHQYWGVLREGFFLQKPVTPPKMAN